jgi:hypothetical protein
MEIQAQVEPEAAEARGAGFVSVFDVFNGPNHDEDPVEKGWMQDDRCTPEAKDWMSSQRCWPPTDSR